MEPDLKEILSAFKEALEFWELHLSGDSAGLRSVVSPAKVDVPLEELVKLAKLIRAHTTKVGILFEPSNFKNADTAATKTVSELSSAFVLYTSVLAQLSPEAISKLFNKEILAVSASLVSSTSLLVTELNALLKKAELDTTETEKVEENRALELHTQEFKETSEFTVDPRLVSVGKVWSNCDAIVSLIAAGNLKFLEKQTKMYLSLIDDGLDEFSEFAENPQSFNEDDDPFGIEDEFSDEENDDEPPTAPEVSDNEDEEPSKEKKYLTEYCKLWLDKFKLLKLLFLSINKSLPQLIGGESIDHIDEAQELICRDVDLLIVDLMLSQVVDHVVESHAICIDKGCYRIVEILKKVNEKSPTKVKWCVLWESKYLELLDAMYNRGF